MANKKDFPKSKRKKIESRNKAIKQISTIAKEIGQPEWGVASKMKSRATLFDSKKVPVKNPKTSKRKKPLK